VFQSGEIPESIAALCTTGSWQLRLDIYDATKGVYLPVFHTPVPQEAGSRYLLEYYPTVATRDKAARRDFSDDTAWNAQHILGDADVLPKPGRKNKLLAPMPLPFTTHLSREGDLLAADSEESCLGHHNLICDRFIWRLQGPLAEHGFVLKRRNRGRFDFKRSKGKQLIEGNSSPFLSGYSKRLTDIFIQHMGEKHCKKIVGREGMATFALRLWNVRKLCVPSWVKVAKFSEYVTSYEEIDWLAEDLLHYALPMMNEALTVRGMDNLYNKRFCVSDLFQVTSSMLETASCSLIYARLAGNSEFDRIVDEIRQIFMKEENEYYMEFYTDLFDVCKNHLQPLEKDAPA
jgi:hypothetical protein